MADQKISQLPTITGANMADDDKFVLVDTSGDATVATTRAEFFKNTPNIDVTGIVNSDELTVDYGTSLLRGDLAKFTASNFDGGGSNASGEVNIIGDYVNGGMDLFNVKRNTQTVFKVDGEAGRVGIGVDGEPTGKLQIYDAQFDLGAANSTASISFITPVGNAESLIDAQIGGNSIFYINAQGNVGIGTSSPSTDSILDVQSTTKGVRFPNMTTTQKNAMGDVAGNMVFDTTLGKMCFNTGSGWETITSS